MIDLTQPRTTEDARADHHERAVARARDCVRFAVLTSESLAADLIDRAVEIRRTIQCADAV